MKETGIRVSKEVVGLADRRIILWQRPSGPRPLVTDLHGGSVAEIACLAMDLSEVSDSNPPQQMLTCQHLAMEPSRRRYRHGSDFA